MDDPGVDPLALDHAMAHLQVINRWLNGYGPSLDGIKSLLHPHQDTFSLLDVGCGSGDTLRAIAAWARKRGLTAHLTGIELSAQTAERAAEDCAGWPEIKIFHRDLFKLQPDQQYDLVHGALMLHHFSEDTAAAKAMEAMARHAKLGIIINDLHRHPAAYGSIWFLTRLLSRSKILQNDAPLSVARSFTRADLQQLAENAGLSDITIAWKWAFRWLLTARLASPFTNDSPADAPARKI